MQPSARHSFPLPGDEAARVAAIHSCRVLDMPQQNGVRLLTDLAATVFSVPVSLVSVIEEQRQVMLAIHGPPVGEMPRSTSFCTYALLQDDILFVGDATQDVRFADNPLVTAAPFLRFYAGVPILGPRRHKIGTFCILDHLPRPELTSRERRALSGFAELASEIISANLPGPLQ